MKHQVSFDEAKTVFDDPLYIDFYDPDHSVTEDRYLIVGQSNRERVLIVAYTERGRSIRLISAREVTLQQAVSVHSSYLAAFSLLKQNLFYDA